MPVKSKELSPYELGRTGELAALKYLRKNKFKIIQKGFRLFRGEIDIIALDGQTLVFIEVKTRRSYQHGFPEESVSSAKQNQIRKIAQGYLSLHGKEEAECRFDVLSLMYDESNGFSINHIKDAF